MDKLSLNEVIKVTNAESNSSENIFFDGVTTDSRKIVDGTLFVALKGEKFNGEDFVEDSFKKGATAALVSKNFNREISNGVIIKVDDTLKAYQQIAGAWRDRFKIPIIAVTGSTGKTTTKDLTAAVLSELGKILKTSANFNNEIGVPMTLLELTEEHKAAVVEIGMRGLRQIAALAKIVKPTVAIVTNVNETHMELLGSMENIAKAKGELVESIQAGGTVILNVDNHYVADMVKLVKPGVKIITNGIEKPADLKAENVVTGEASTDFDLLYKGKLFHFDLPIIGRHNVSNALAAIAAGMNEGLLYKRSQRGLLSFATTKMRFEVIRRDKITIVNDAYNASPASMRAAIKTSAEIYDTRKIAVLGDMFELGDIAEKAHREIGEYVFENGFEILITVGELGKFIAEGAKAAGMKNVFVTDSHEDAAKTLRGILQHDDVILFKASHGMHMEKVIELI